LVLALANVPAAALGSGHPMTVEDMLDLRTPSGLALSPDGSTLAYVLASRSLETNSGRSEIRLLRLSGKDATDTRFAGADGAHEGEIAWHPGGAHLAFVSDPSGDGQVWMAATDGRDPPRQLTTLATGAGTPRWLPDGTGIVFTSRVYPECADAACNAARLKAEAEDPVRARAFSALMIRHWDAWRDGRVLHLHRTPLTGPVAEDLMPGDTWGVADEWVLAADGSFAVFATKDPEGEALSTDTGLARLELHGAPADGLRRGVLLSGGNPAWDGRPALSGDGRRLLHLAHRRPGFESDRTWLTLRDATGAGEPRTLGAALDRWVNELGWFPDGRAIWFTVQDRGRVELYTLALGRDDEAPRRIVEGGMVSDVVVSPDGKRFWFVHQTLRTFPEIWTARADGRDLRRLTGHNDEVAGRLDLAEVEDFTWTGADGAPVHGFLLFPPGTSRERSNPFLLLIHGGPQGMWTDAMHPRWNAQVLAAPGYVTLLPNPRGSSGYGQEFTDQVSRDWGGRPFTDLMAGVDALIARGIVDPGRMAAGGGSYGGYMANWILGQTDRFRCLVSHAGVYDLVSMYGSTEELWFPEWEYGGTPWDAPGDYERFSPSRFVTAFRTPTLVIHGAGDFRVPENQAMQLFTALQRRGVPSRFLYFPDETHFVAKPRNSKLWYDEFQGWLARWLAP
ncbi:MAG: S9 family peptidase, partial [Deltaproteobacteria bacterium]|nr:S9 family peptidase [Deltaproteobacteria bacterium]